MPDRSLFARAFNLGSDARIGCVPLAFNPYSRGDSANHRYWREGWKHVDSCWGRDARWPIRPLPVIGEVA